MVVVTGRFNDALLDVIPQKHGAFAYHFLKGATERDRVPLNEAGVLELRPVLDYAWSRIEDESRILNQSQSILTYGGNSDFPLIEPRR